MAGGNGREQLIRRVKETRQARDFLLEDLKLLFSPEFANHVIRIRAYGGVANFIYPLAENLRAAQEHFLSEFVERDLEYTELDKERIRGRVQKGRNLKPL